MKKPVIEFRDFGMRYASQQKPTLYDINLTIYEGEKVLILGPSGSGKSTFLSLLAGLDVPTEGSIYVEGQDIRTMDRDRYRREQAAVIYQAFHLFPLLTVLENVMFPMNLRKVPKKEARRRAVELLDKVGLPDALHQKMPGMISGGEQQRVAIARAMASGARIILADEPTGNLDSQNEKNVIDLLEGMAHEEGYTVIIVTHSEKIAGTADVVYGMLDGRLEVVRP